MVMNTDSMGDALKFATDEQSAFENSCLVLQFSIPLTNLLTKSEIATLFTCSTELGYLLYKYRREDVTSNVDFKQFTKYLL